MFTENFAFALALFHSTLTISFHYKSAWSATYIRFCQCWWNWYWYRRDSVKVEVWLLGTLLLWVLWHCCLSGRKDICPALEKCIQLTKEVLSWNKKRKNNW